jgi:hypothetical protein
MVYYAEDILSYGTALRFDIGLDHSNQERR